MHTNRLDRIKEEYGKPSREFDWFHVRGIPGESHVMWRYFKDHVPLRRNCDRKPDLTKWGQKIYETYVPPKDKPKTFYAGKEMSCQSAAREGNPFAIMITSLLRWVIRQEQMGKKGNADVIMWLESCR